MKNTLFLLITFSALTVFFSFSSNSKNTCIRERIITWHDSAHKVIKAQYWLCNGVLDSLYNEFDKNGVLVVSGSYKNGKKSEQWMEYIPQNSSRKGVKTFMTYDNGFLYELRRYTVDNNQLYLSSLSLCYLKSDDTIQIRRNFDIKTGFMTSLDTSINEIIRGSMYYWSPTTGHLKQINGKINTPDQYEKLFLKNGGYELIHYHKNMAVREKQLYNCEGVMVSKQLFDTLGKPLKARK
jgi:hypothetical protein